MSSAERLIFLDTETTGMPVTDGHRIIEVGAIEVIDLQETGNVFHEYFDPQRDIDPDAQRVHGITRESLKGKPEFFEKAVEFSEFVAGATLVIHNSEFDIGFLKNELRIAGVAPSWAKVVDTLHIARRRFSGSPVSLDALADRFNIDRSGRTLHGALKDVQLLYRVYIPLLGLNELLPVDMGVESRESETAAEIFPMELRQGWFPERALSEVSSDELARHAAFVAGLSKDGKPSLWDALRA